MRSNSATLFREDLQIDLIQSEPIKEKETDIHDPEPVRIDLVNMDEYSSHNSYSARSEPVLMIPLIGS